MREAERRWWDGMCFATVRPDYHRWMVVEVSYAGLRMPGTAVERRRTYDTLDQAMAAAERRNRLLRRREAAEDAEWPLNDDPLPWEPQVGSVYSPGWADEMVHWHLDRFAARADDDAGRPTRPVT